MMVFIIEAEYSIVGHRGWSSVKNSWFWSLEVNSSGEKDCEIPFIVFSLPKSFYEFQARKYRCFDYSLSLSLSCITFLLQQKNMFRWLCWDSLWIPIIHGSRSSIVPKVWWKGTKFAKFSLILPFLKSGCPKRQACL